MVLRSGSGRGSAPSEVIADLRSSALILATNDGKDVMGVAAVFSFAHAFHKVVADWSVLPSSLLPLISQTISQQGFSDLALRSVEG